MRVVLPGSKLVNNPIGPNDKQHHHLPDYVVVDLPHLKLPPYIDQWDKLHPMVMSMKNYLQYFTVIPISDSRNTFLYSYHSSTYQSGKNNNLLKGVLYCHLVPFGNFLGNTFL